MKVNGKNIKLSSGSIYGYDPRPLSLRWHESIWTPEFDHCSEASNKKLMHCFNQRWKGLSLSNVSNHELKAIRRVCNDPKMIMITCDRSASGMNLQDVEVMQKGIEVWFATKQLILDAHYALCSMPVRSRIAVTNLPIDPLIKKTLRGLNYLCLQDTTKDKSEKRHMRGMISVQEFDGVEKMLAILALTR